ncbi:MAG: FAD-dependent oxidoreductase [Chloroflexi bacterium]|nr:FAD-dependent oxidoreductase [Chloroflexota bacterium]
MPQTNVIVYGTNWCGDCRRAKQLLAEHMVNFRWIDIDKDAEARAFVERANKGKRSVPTIVFDDGSILVEPSNAQLAQKLGVSAEAKMRYYDLVVVGGGACGLTAASYTARERVRTLVIERSGLGGQASITDVVENVPGFANQLSGTEFAKQITQQARRFGVEIIEEDVERIEVADNYRLVHLGEGKAINASALLLATGATYRRLGVPGEDALLGAGVHYCAACDAPFYRGAEELVVVGGGNSAAQEALLLTQYAQRVTLITRESRLDASQAALEKLAATPSIQIRLNTIVTGLRGNQKLEAVVTKNLVTEQTDELRPNGMFVFIGMAPNNHLAKDLVTLDSEGYIVTGHDLVHQVGDQLQSAGAPAYVRMPHAMETSVRGIFAAGDVRSGSTKQVASAVGEGASAAIAIREYLRGE